MGRDVSRFIFISSYVLIEEFLERRGVGRFVFREIAVGAGIRYCGELFGGVSVVCIMVWELGVLVGLV